MVPSENEFDTSALSPVTQGGASREKEAGRKSRHYPKKCGHFFPGQSKEAGPGCSSVQLSPD